MIADILFNPIIPLILSGCAIFSFLKYSRPAPIADRRLSGGLSELGPVDASKGLASLVSYAMEYRPDHVVGINRGGVLLGAWICYVTCTPSTRFHKCGVIRGDSSGVEDLCFDKLKGRVLVVDDIARTGGTLISTAVDVMKKCPSVEAVRTAVLVVAQLDDLADSKVDRISFAAYSTENKHLIMPWSIAAGANAANQDDNVNDLEILDADRIRREFEEVEVKKIGDLVEEFIEVVNGGNAANSG